jgi:hypothetical protein
MTKQETRVRLSQHPRAAPVDVLDFLQSPSPIHPLLFIHRTSPQADKMSTTTTNRPSPTKQPSHPSAQRKRRHSALSPAPNGSEDEEHDEPLASSVNPLVKPSASGPAAATGGGRKRGGAKAAAWNPAGVDLATVGHAVDYRYTTEISQMVSVSFHGLVRPEGNGG